MDINFPIYSSADSCHTGFTTNETIGSSIIEPLETGTVLHGLFKVKNETCECYFDGEMLYWMPVQRNHRVQEPNTNTNVANQLSIKNIHGIKLKCLKTVKNNTIKKTTTGLAIFCRQLNENNRYQECQISLELMNSHDICLEWGRKILAAISDYERPKSALVLGEDGMMKNVVEHFFSRARISYQYFSLDGYGSSTGSSCYSSGRSKSTNKSTYNTDLLTETIFQILFDNLDNTILFCGKFSWICQIFNDIISKDSRLLLAIQDRKIAFIPKFPECNFQEKSLIEEIIGARSVEEAMLGVIYGKSKLVRPVRVQVEEQQRTATTKICFNVSLQNISENYLLNQQAIDFVLTTLENYRYRHTTTLPINFQANFLDDFEKGPDEYDSMKMNFILGARKSGGEADVTPVPVPRSRQRVRSSSGAGSDSARSSSNVLSFLSNLNFLKKSKNLLPGQNQNLQMNNLQSQSNSQPSLPYYLLSDQMFNIQLVKKDDENVSHFLNVDSYFCLPVMSGFRVESCKYQICFYCF